MTKIETIADYRREQMAQDAARAAGEAVLVRLATRLFALRTALKLTQEELAARAGLDQASISDIENGDANPTARTIGRVASGLGVDASALLEHGAVAVRWGAAVKIHDDFKWQGAVQQTVGTEGNRTAATKITIVESVRGVAVQAREKVAVG